MVASATKAKRVAKRLDAVFIRKSGSSQDERAQIANVRQMLGDQGFAIPRDEEWFACTVPRAKVAGNADFKRLIALVEADKVGTVYVESQDRWGTDDVTELFTLLGILSAHRTRLFDLKEGIDLTGKDETTQIKAFLGGLKSKKERQDLAYRSMRTKVQNFKTTATWPTGPHPFGFGKACYAADGKTLLWVWQPRSRFLGQLFHADKSGKLTAGPPNTKLPRKLRGEINRLVPSDQKEYVGTIKLIFSLYTRAGLSRRMISARLNEGGRMHYDRPFTHAIVAQILSNSAYVGDIAFGKSKTARHWSFDSDGNLEKIERADQKQQRETGAQLVRKNVHKGLITRQTWNLAQRRLADQKERTSYSPRNPNYYLKPLLVCGHCGRNMTGSTEGDKVVYFCSSYKLGKSSGQKVGCGAHRITHDDAEQLLLGKIKEKNIEFDDLASALGRKHIARQVDSAESATGDRKIERFRTYVEGFRALTAFYKQNQSPSPKQLETFESQAREYYKFWKHDRKSFNKKFAKIVAASETDAVERAKSEVIKLSKSLERYTEAWVDASDMQREILKGKCDKLERELEAAKLRCKPVSERLSEIFDQLRELNSDLETLGAELPTMECREKGEALRRAFKSVTLFWKQDFIPRSGKPTRPLKTKRPGRNKFTLLQRKIRWELATPDLGGTS